MIEKNVTIPDLILIGSTRVALGLGAGLLLGGWMNDSRRKGAGWALFTFGLLTTLPIALNVLGKPSSQSEPAEQRIESAPKYAAVPH